MSFTDANEPVPAELRTPEFLLRPIRADDAEADHAALMETRVQLRLWEQSAWPEDDFTVEANRADLIDLQRRHAAHRAFTYTVLDPVGTSALGCVYVFPPSAAFLARSTVTALGDDEWEQVEAVVYFWTRLSQTEKGLDARLLDALRDWFRVDWRFERTVYVTNEQFEQQAGLIAGTGLTLKFELVEPGKPGTYLVFG